VRASGGTDAFAPRLKEALAKPKSSMKAVRMNFGRRGGAALDDEKPGVAAADDNDDEVDAAATRMDATASARPAVAILRRAKSGRKFYMRPHDRKSTL